VPALGYASVRADVSLDGPEVNDQRHTIEDTTHPTSQRIEREEIADTMNDLLQGPLSAGGTAGGKNLPDRPAAGKTGTTQDNGNAWFVGYTPQLSTAVWMGHVGDQRPMGPVKGVRAVTGGTWPARTWQAFMKRAHEGLPKVEFNQPAPITDVADEAKRAARKGYDVGVRRRPTGVDDGGNLNQDLPPPEVEPPTSSTTTTTIFGF